MDLEVRPEELRDAASKINNNLDHMKAANEDATRNINGTAANWESNAAENLRERYANLSKNFEDFYNAITKYCKFLENTAASYEEADQQITQKADDLLNQGYNA